MRAAAYRAKDIIIRIVGREHDDAAVRPGKARDAVAGVGIGQLEVQKNDVRMKPGGEAQAFGDAVCGAHDIDVRFALQYRRDTLADDGMILDDEDANHADPAASSP